MLYQNRQVVLSQLSQFSGQYLVKPYLSVERPGGALPRSRPSVDEPSSPSKKGRLLPRVEKGPAPDAVRAWGKPAGTSWGAAGLNKAAEHALDEIGLAFSLRLG
jgi:hypothetical protein